MAQPDSIGEPLLVFYDCEFTDLTSDSDLLSIGFTAAEFEQELYIEIQDAQIQLSSFFVRDTVLPLFGRHDPERLTRTDAAKRIDAWLDDVRDSDRDLQIFLVSDSNWDWQHLLGLMGTPMPGEAPWARRSNVVGRLVGAMLRPDQQGVFSIELSAYHARLKEQHHALVDARALKAAWWESRFV